MSREAAAPIAHCTSAVSVAGLAMQDTWDWRGGLKDRRAEDFRFG
jgi:hypothetical protein